MPKNEEYVSLSDYNVPAGRNFADRLSSYHNWQLGRRKNGTWVYDKTLFSAPRPSNKSSDGCGRMTEGPNLCSQDYLSLSTHPEVIEAARQAALDYGVHSAGSSALLGNTDRSKALEANLAEFLGYEYALLFPTGWSAGYGLVTGLVRPNDYIVMDALSHACLKEGARNATKNVHSIPHLSNRHVEGKLSRIRAKDKDNAILVISESLFSMDSDTPDIAELQDICRRYDATLMIDAAHDLGALAPRGGGTIEMQDMVGKVDIVMGSFSKTFASNGGFVATNRPEIIEYLKMFACPQTFSNALSPLAVAIVTKSLEIIRSDEGAMRRVNLRNNSMFIRTELQRAGYHVIGDMSAIVPVLLGDDEKARKLWRVMSDRGVASNLVEFPAVVNNQSRLRLQLQANHTLEDMHMFVRALIEAQEELAKKDNAA